MWLLPFTFGDSAISGATPLFRTCYFISSRLFNAPLLLPGLDSLFLLLVLSTNFLANPVIQKSHGRKSNTFLREAFSANSSMTKRMCTNFVQNLKFLLFRIFVKIIPFFYFFLFFYFFIFLFKETLINYLHCSYSTYNTTLSTYSTYNTTLNTYSTYNTTLNTYSTYNTTLNTYSTYNTIQYSTKQYITILTLFILD